MTKIKAAVNRHKLACMVLGLVWMTACNRTVNSAGKEPAIKTDSISFIVIGDWGKKGKQGQKRVAAAMGEYVKKHPVQFIISTGDNFYYAGVHSIKDKHWQSSFENIYIQNGLQVPWYPVLGNHDHGLNPEAQIEYSAFSKRWTMPSFYYALKKKVSGNTDVLLLFTDTSPLVSDYYPSSLPNLLKRDTAAQRKWLEKEVINATEKWKIVIGHHPLYSAGKHGNTKDLVNLFKPLFKKGQVDFYLSGHDHSLQHLKVANENVQYLVSGAGSERTPVSAHIHSRFTRSVPGFLVMSLYADRAKFAFYNALGSLLYKQEIKKS